MEQAVTAYDQVVARFARFGKKPIIAVYSPTEYRVEIVGWHVHNGAATSALFADGRSLEKACAALLKYIERPASMVVEGDCDYQCASRYMKSKSHQAAARASLRTVVDEAADAVDHWPAWKRGLPPCEEDECERELGHDGKHRHAKPVEYVEW